MPHQPTAEDVATSLMFAHHTLAGALEAWPPDSAGKAFLETADQLVVLAIRDLKESPA